MDPNRKFWNEQQQKLQRALARPEDHQKTIGLFLDHHAMVHSAKMSQTGLWSFEDEVLEGLTEADIRSIPENEEHSIAWVIWHIARIEDVTMNMLLMNKKQVFTTGKWQKKLNITVSDTGNLMLPKKIAQLGKQIDIAALKKYRDAVGKRTRKNVQALDPVQWKRKVDPARIARLVPEGAVNPAATQVLEYWGGLTYAGLLLMPPTRHNLIHLNEIIKMKRKLIRL